LSKSDTSIFRGDLFIFFGNYMISGITNTGFEENLIYSMHRKNRIKEIEDPF
jgi:hypothetical protein